jgi:hypothetical protein
LFPQVCDIVISTPTQMTSKKSAWSFLKEILATTAILRLRESRTCRKEKEHAAKMIFNNLCRTLYSGK